MKLSNKAIAKHWKHKYNVTRGLLDEAISLIGKLSDDLPEDDKFRADAEDFIERAL